MGSVDSARYVTTWCRSGRKSLAFGKSMLHDQPRLLFYRWHNNPFIPVEFSAAAYRFGHSMVRPIYRLNTTLGANPPPSNDPVNGRQFIFHPDDDTQSLTICRTSV